MEDSIYHGKDGRLRVYVRETKKTVSYPKYLMEKELGRKLLPGEEVHHKDENPLNNNIDNNVFIQSGVSDESIQIYLFVLVNVLVDMVRDYRCNIVR